MEPGDERLIVEFYKKLWQNPSESLLQGRPIFQEKEWIKILVPGNQLTVIDTLVEEHHKMRFPEHYQRFVESGEDSQAISGTPLSTWSAITRDVAEKLRYKKFFTVEQVANASDHQLMAIGMDVGMQPHDFKNLARAYLESAAKTGDIMKRQVEMDLLRADNDELRAQHLDNIQRIKTLEASVAAFLAAQQAQESAKRPARVRKKPQAKSEDEAEVTVTTQE